MDLYRLFINVHNRLRVLAVERDECPLEHQSRNQVNPLPSLRVFMRKHLKRLMVKCRPFQPTAFSCPTIQQLLPPLSP